MVVSNCNINFIKPAKLGTTVVSFAEQLHGGNLSQVQNIFCITQKQVWQAELRDKESFEVIAIVTSTALNLGTKGAEEKQKLQYFAENKKNYGFAFNVSQMTKEEIAAKFDKHAPNWYKKSRIVFMPSGKNLLPSLNMQS